MFDLLVQTYEMNTTTVRVGLLCRPYLAYVNKQGVMATLLDVLTMQVRLHDTLLKG